MSQQVFEAYFEFLNELKKNNNRDWFDAHKSEFKKLDQEFKKFCKNTRDQMQEFDVIEREKVFRIYRDVRFSKNKQPYKTNRSVIFYREGAIRRGSYYFQIAPGKSFVGGGFFAPESGDLLRIRKEFEVDAKPIREILSQKDFENAFGGFMNDNVVKTAPKGFSKEDPNIDLIRNKKFAVKHDFTDAEVLQPDFQEKLLSYFKLMLPFLDYMTEVLTTDLNGEPII
ncbi:MULTISPECIES: DUF2461 domain-containing protein [unclassified Leeuwenhoekiella]|uniref:DUF2461 domain-containing protein n=1 Tax=unclassified Leeuwenhoekiella TaxID=2615029 RepID=UPI000C4489C2|nr:MULTISPECIES: DUF2461 domain-containing protein [unclassified Leeuwenhoekiella]MBA81833.1 TIGR02453 family protein [Leeuwenhoekiella sp.]|tara:strand:- start:19600 stop:20277 length:678 start_codon:yes stop_codon:yes gene_type:complete